MTHQLFKAITAWLPEKIATQASSFQSQMPSQKNPRRKIPSQLEAICMKALEKEPAKRQPSISELIMQVRDFQQHQKMIS